MSAYRRGKVMAMRWKDKKDVVLLSTVHNSDEVEIASRRGTKKKPKVVVDYNHTMGGVDKLDQNLANYPVPRKRTKKYYKKVFFHHLDLALWNAYQCFKMSNENCCSSLKFRLEIIDSTLKKYHAEIPQTRPGRPSISANPTRYSGRHFPIDIPPTPKKKFPTRQCVVCSKKRDNNGKPIRRESRYMCEICEVSLCIPPASNHTIQNDWEIHWFM
ncbi:piggyBac transposable element-derived protein 4-like [Macrobrachium nipponense]|uniref:piggyBac transposable element-derived protein 4-like n=1 Tax=Macrobrachium nipponense TaxID=159736 RepID=UPI0030C7DED3